MDESYFDGPGRDWLEIVPRSYAQPEFSAPAFDYRPAYTQGLHPLSPHQLLTRKFEPPEHVLAPWLQTQGLTMIHAPRGIGKTHISIGAACAVAAGTGFLKWSAPKPRRVLFIDGEMPGAMLQERFARTIDALKADVPPDGFKLVAADLEPDGLPDLASEEGQQFYAEVIAPADLVITDNLSTICRTLRENEADSWGPVQSWALRLRREGKSVLFIHHAGKNGGQRGTSKKEDILNTVIALRRPPDYEASQGARFEVHYEKARGFYGNEAEPFEAWLKDGQWLTAEVTSADDDASLLALKKQGLSDREIEKRTGVPKSTVNRKLREKALP
jgi:AAA domain-containing protein